MNRIHIVIFNVIQLLALFYCNISISQVINFQCDPNFKFINQSLPIYDSLNRINYHLYDFELRVWKTTNGQAGLEEKIFLMRHIRTQNTWQTFLYDAYQGNDFEYVSIEKFFEKTQLKKITNKKSELIWKELCDEGILTLKPLTEDSLSKILNENYYSRFPIEKGSLPQVELGSIRSDHDTKYYFEIISSECKRSYGFSESSANNEDFSQIKEFTDLKKLIQTIRNALKPYTYF